MNSIEITLNKYVYCSTIKKIDIDLTNKEITFYLTLNDNNHISSHVLKFGNCASFLWVSEEAHCNGGNPIRWDALELTSIELRKTKTSTNDKWLGMCSIEYNIAVEIWDMALLINASELIVDDQHFYI